MSTEIEVKYNILRGDYYRLSKKLDYYESGKAFEDLNKEHDKEIRCQPFFRQYVMASQ